MSPLRLRASTLIGLFSTCLLWGSGCERSPPMAPPPRASSDSSAEAGGDSLSRAMDLVRRYDEFQPDLAAAQVHYHLTNWAEALEDKSGWDADPLVSRLPPDYREIPAITELPYVRYSLDDVYYLLENVWLRQISRQATRTPARASLLAWLKELEAQKPLVAQKLSICERLFDWTTRNIQLDPLLPYPEDAAAPAAAPVGTPTAAPPTAAVKPPPMRGVPGPGYTRLPWQTLMLGHGDAYERARIFILLARQQGIDAVMLAINEDFSPRARPWAVGVLLEGDLYLFDPQLGLPIPAQDERGIASLGELRAEPALLRRLDLDESRKYPMQEADLKRIVALLEAAPQALSHRMAEIELHLVGDQQMSLTTAPSELAAKVQKVPGVTLAQIWSVGCEAVVYGPASQATVMSDPVQASKIFEETMGFARHSPMGQGRHLHFMGTLDNSEDTLGAKGKYLAARINREQLDAMSQDPEYLKSLGLVRAESENEAMYQARLQALKVLFVRAKMNCSYWLGLTQYETGNYQAAVEWFRQRTIEAFPDGPWTQGAKYNLARSLEELGQIDAARDILFVDESPQQHGNILRARWLKK